MGTGKSLSPPRGWLGGGAGQLGPQGWGKSLGCHPGRPPPGTETQAGPASHPGWVAASPLPVPQRSPADPSPAPPFSSRGPRKEGRGGLVQGCLLSPSSEPGKDLPFIRNGVADVGSVGWGVVSGSRQPPPQTHPTAAGHGIQRDTTPPPQAVPPSRGRSESRVPQAQASSTSLLGRPQGGRVGCGRAGLVGQKGCSSRAPGAQPSSSW